MVGEYAQDNMLFIITGNGKGKTTGAVGMAVRAMGAGKRVSMVQFLKAGSSSEIEILNQLGSMDIRSFGRKGFIVNQKTEQDIELAKQGLQYAKNALENNSCDFLVLDELCVALHFNLLPLNNVLSLLKEHKDKKHIVITGRKCPNQIIEMADLVTECREIKHYYTKGVPSQKGIEF